MKKFLILILSSIIFTANFAYAANTVDLIWEGETYTPTFYAGRPLPTTGNLVRVVAVPSVAVAGQTLAVSQLVFRWIKDFTPIQSASGVGKNVLEYRANQNGAASSVSVEISTEQGDKLAEARVIINSGKPKVVLYGIQPLANPDRTLALTGITPINTSETTLLAQPFYFSRLDFSNRNLTYDWRVNGTSAPAQQEDARFFTVAAGGGGEGQAPLMVTIKNAGVPPQTASRTINLGFGLRNFTF